MSTLQEVSYDVVKPQTQMPVFRFKFNQNVVEAVMRFAKIHQHDDRHDYKETWKEWCIENNELLDTEVKRLEAIGYTGDIYDKLFKSGRYYFRNKQLAKTQPIERKKYVGLSRNALKSMDEFINDTIMNGNKKASPPAEAFNTFCEKNKDVLKKEIVILLNDYCLDENDVSDKLKKTFKNRYYQKVRKSGN